jgi:hypothetical protein
LDTDNSSDVPAEDEDEEEKREVTLSQGEYMVYWSARCLPAALLILTWVSDMVGMCEV